MSGHSRILLELAQFSPPIGWSPDGRWLYILDTSTDHVLKVNARDGNVARTYPLPADSGLWEGMALGFSASPDLSPDGSTLMFSVGENRRNAWIVENFDARSETGRTH